MNRIKLVSFIALAVFLGGSFSGATAQTRTSSLRFTAPPLPVVIALSGTYSVKVDAIELSRGQVDFTSGTTYGWTCYGKTEGDLSGFMFVSLNYDAPAGFAGGIDVMPVGGASSVVGGSWSKLVFMKGEYVGSISGTIIGGNLIWNEKTQNWSVNLNLLSEQGTEALVGNTGKGSFAGTLDQNGKVSTVSGLLTLDY